MNHAEELNKIIDSANQSLGRETAEKTAPNPNIFFTTSVLGMKAVSHVIEDQALKSSNTQRFYSAFQKFSRVKQQQERYEKLTKAINSLYIFGIPDVPLWQHDHLKPIPITENTNPNLAQNWCVVLQDPKLISMALVSRELPATTRITAGAERLIYRNFEGFWTYDADIVDKVVAILDSYIETHS